MRVAWFVNQVCVLRQDGDPGSGMHYDGSGPSSLDFEVAPAARELAGRRCAGIRGVAPWGSALRRRR
jgi:hypothetical protein